MFNSSFLQTLIPTGIQTGIPPDIQPEMVLDALERGESLEKKLLSEYKFYEPVTGGDSYLAGELMNVPRPVANLTISSNFLSHKPARDFLSAEELLLLTITCKKLNNQVKIFAKEVINVGLLSREHKYIQNLKIFYYLVVMETEKQQKILNAIGEGLEKQKEILLEDGSLNIEYFTPKITWLNRLIIATQLLSFLTVSIAAWYLALTKDEMYLFISL